MGRGIAVFFTDSISVETWQGTDSLGRDVFGSPTVVHGYADQKRSMVRISESEEVVSNTIVYTYTVNKDIFKPNSRVTINGDTTFTPRVLNVATFGVNSLRLPDHLSVLLG